jgi:hypothetical protein
VKLCDPRAVAYRLRQEAVNASRLLFPPRARSLKPQSLPLPGGAAIAEKLRNTAYAAEVERLAAQVLAHRFPLLGVEIGTADPIDWRKDHLHGITTGPAYFARIPYLDFSRSGDHKVIWELNRHQHLVLLAQGWLLSSNADLLPEIWRAIQSWIEQNPYPRGINWASALEVAFRALSWLWVDHLAGSHMPPALRRSFLDALHIHAAHLRTNLSVYFSPNTHLLGEAVALHALGLFFQNPDWLATGADIVHRSIKHQVRDDGAYFEQSTYYHVYALDMLLFHAILEPPQADYRDRLRRMARFLRAVAGPQREIPFIGDDDGGRFFHPYGSHARYARATLAACAAFGIAEDVTYTSEDLHPLAAWWLGAVDGENCAELHSERFPDSGFAVLTDGATHCVVDAGPFGPFRGGHTHAGKLSLTLCRNGEWLLFDPGTYTYVADPALRDRFRGTAMHNTVRIDGLDQAEPAGPFAWREPPHVRLTSWKTGPARDELEAECRYRGFRHVRRIVWEKPSCIFVTDEIEGPAGTHELEQCWHAGTRARLLSPREFALGAGAALVLDGEAEHSEGGEFGWRSPAFAARVPAPVICLHRRTTLPARFQARILLSE